MLTVKHLRKSFSNNLIFSDVSFQIQKGEVVGLIGRNGAGKTTLMKCLLGLVHEDSGSISFLGDDQYLQDENKLGEIGFLLDCSLYDYMNAYDNVKIQQMYAKGKEEPNQIEDILKFVGLENNKKFIKSYSFGMKQRLGLGIALMNNPELLIVDEPFVGLDPNGIEIIKGYLSDISKERGTSILVSSHQLSEIDDMCDRFLILSDGVITEYSKASKKISFCVNNISLKQKNILKEYLKEYGCDFDGNTISMEYDMKVFNDILRQIMINNGFIEEVSVSNDSIKDIFINN